jgi:hypothetical protein
MCVGMGAPHKPSRPQTSTPTFPPPPPPPVILPHTHTNQPKTQTQTPQTTSFGFVKRVLASLLPTLGGTPKSFTDAFEAEHGKRHPTFVEAPTLTQALAAARVATKFLVVYLPSASPRDEKRHRTFCRTLTDPEVKGGKGEGEGWGGEWRGWVVGGEGGFCDGKNIGWCDS